MKKNITMAWKRVKNVVEQNKLVGSVVFTIFSIFIGGILVTSGVAIFEPTYTYPSIGTFVISFLIGGCGFVTILGFLSSIIVLENYLDKIYE